MLEFDPHIITSPITWSLMTYYNVAFDESGKANDSHVIFAGFFDTDVRWSEFSRQWKAKMRPYGFEYFHAKQAFHFKGPWEQFKGDTEKEIAGHNLIRALADLIEDFPKEGITHTIGSAEFKALPSHKRESVRNDPFYAAFDASLKNLVAKPSVDPSDRFYLICDDSEEYSGQCLEMYRRFRRADPANATRFAGICFVDDESYAPLQLADLYAYIIRRNAMGIHGDLSAELYDKYVTAIPNKTLSDILS